MLLLSNYCSQITHSVKAFYSDIIAKGIRSSLLVYRGFKVKWF